MFGRRVVAITCISGRCTQPGVLPTIQGVNRSQFFSPANRRKSSFAIEFQEMQDRPSAHE